MKIYFSNFSDFDVKSYDVEETISVSEFIKLCEEYAEHSDLKEIYEIEVALNILTDTETNISLNDMMSVFNNVVEDWSKEFYVCDFEGMGYYDGDEFTVEISDLREPLSFGIEDQKITFKNLKEDTVKSFEEGIKEWISNLKYVVYDDDFFDDAYTQEKFDEHHANGIKKFLEYIDSGEFRNLITPSEEYYDAPNIIALVDLWNTGTKLSKKMYDLLDVETFMDEADAD